MVALYIDEMKKYMKKRYHKYEEAIEHAGMMEWFKREIAKSSDGIIRVPIIDITKELGSGFQDLTSGAIYMAMAYLLYKKGIIVNMGSTTDGKKLLILRIATGLDSPPNWLKRLLEKDNEFFKKEKVDNKSVIRKEKESAILKIREETELKRREIRETKNRMLKDIEEKKQSILKELGDKEASLKEVFDNNTYRVDIFVFDMNKLGWKVKRSKLASNNMQLLELIKDGTSRPDARCRIEITPVGGKIKEKVEKKGVEEVVEVKVEKKNIGIERPKEKEEKLAIVGSNDADSQPKEVTDKLNSLLLIDDLGQRAAAKYLIQKNAKKKKEE